MLFKKIVPQDKKGAGLIMGLVMGIAALVIAVIIAFVIISTIATIESDTAGVTGASVINESGYLNHTEYTVDTAGIAGFTNPVITAITNISDSAIIDPANATISDAGVLNNASADGNQTFWDAVYFSYTYDYQITTVSTEGLRAGFTAGIDEVSEKIPTVLLIAVIVLVLGVLVLLWTQYKRMDIGGGSAGL